MASQPSRNQALRFIVLAAAIGCVAYTALYFPYPPGSLPVRVLTWYLRLVARAAAAGASLFDHSAVALGDVVQGSYSVKIVLDCAALDAHALYGAAVLAFPARWSARAWGLLLGTALLAVVNVGRIVLLYVAGIRWPAAFHVLHEEILQLAIVLAAFFAFLAWILWVQRTSRSP